jgi:hypothetical protein
MTIKVDILLIGSVSRTVSGQEVKITGEPPTTRTGVDGKLSVGLHNREVTWYGGSANDLSGVHHVNMVQSATKAVVLDGDVNTNFTAVHNVSGGVRFDVF